MGASGRVLLTGVSGFVGGHVARELMERGHPVRGLTRRDLLLPGVEAWRYDGLHDGSAIRSAAEGASTLVHLAARVHVMAREGEGAEAEYRRVNVEGSRNAVEAALQGGVSRVVFLSSVKAVGEESGEEPWDETVVPRPVDPYGRSKLEAEGVVLELAREVGVPAVVLRIPLVYGPGMGGNMLRLFEAVRRGVPLPLGRLTNRRSLLYVENLAAAIGTIVARSEATAGVFFLSDGDDLSTPELVHAIAAGFGRRPRLLPVPLRVLAAAARAGDLVERWAPGLRVPLTSRHLQRLASSLRVSPERFFDAYSFMPPTPARDAIGRTTSGWPFHHAPASLHPSGL